MARSSPTSVRRVSSIGGGPIGAGWSALVITGDADPGSSPAMARRMAEAIPGAEAVILPGLRHMGLAENPAQFNGPLIDFLDRALLSA